MKRFAAYLLVVLVSVTYASAQKKELKLDSFTKISFRAGGKLYLRQGSTQRVEVEGDSRYIEELDIRVESNRLIIGRDSWSFFNWDSNDEKITMWVTVPSIDAVSVSGSGDVIGESKFSARNIDLNVSGSGSLVFEGDALGTIDADVSGSGRIDLKGKCQEFDSHVSGSGKVTLDATITERASFGISGSGKILASGTAPEVRANISGAGEVLAANLAVEKCDVRISGSGDVEINVSKELDANISGSGTVAYKGNPPHVNSHSSGSGKVRKL